MELIEIITGFLVGQVIVKGIVAHFLAEQIMKYATVWFSASERKLAIWTHYKDRALGNGHASSSVLGCHQEKCAIF